MCDHKQLHVASQVFTVTGAEESEGSLLIRAVHLKVHCVACGMPFKFVGAERPPPEDPLDFLQGGGPWASASGDEIASWITPLEADSLLTMVPEGRA